MHLLTTRPGHAVRRCRTAELTAALSATVVRQARAATVRPASLFPAGCADGPRHQYPLGQRRFRGNRSAGRGGSRSSARSASLGLAACGNISRSRRSVSGRTRMTRLIGRRRSAGARRAESTAYPPPNDSTPTQSRHTNSQPGQWSSPSTGGTAGAAGASGMRGESPGAEWGQGWMRAGESCPYSIIETCRWQATGPVRVDLPLASPIFLLTDGTPPPATAWNSGPQPKGLAHDPAYLSHHRR